MNSPKDKKPAMKLWQRDLAEALKKASLTQKRVAEPNAALRAAMANLAKANQDSVAETLKTVSATPKTDEGNTPLKAAIADALKKAQELPKGQGAGEGWAKAIRQHSDFKSQDLASTLQRIAALQKMSKPESNIGRLIGLKRASVPKTSTEAQKLAFRAGFVRGMQETTSLNLNPWLRQAETFPNSPTDALREDWMLIERDLWTTVEKMTSQLEELPPQMRVRLAKALANYLQSDSTS